MQGGKQAAKRLKEGLLGYLEDTGDGELSRRGQIWLNIYFNKQGLLSTLQKNNTCTVDEFEDFFQSFHHSSPSFSVVDVGKGKEAADGKIGGCLSHLIVPDLL